MTTPDQPCRGILLAALASLILSCASSGGSPPRPIPGGSGGAPGTGGQPDAAPPASSGGAGGTVDAAASASGGTPGTPDAATTRDASASSDVAVDSAVATADAGLSRASAGCGKANPPAGNLTITAAGATVKYLVSIPPSYDPRTPYPLVFAFHGFGRTEVQCQKEDCLGIQVALGGKAILVYQKSISAGWEDAAVRDRNVQAFQDIVAVMKAGYCVDESRLTISGTSSGASFTNILSCSLGDQFNLSVPFDGAASNTNCKGTPPAMVVNGVKDNVANGEKVRDIYAARNGCPTKPAAELTALRTKITAAFDAKRSEYACVDYVGCTAAPVRWCEHSVPGSDGSTHEWPDQGGQAIADYLQTLK